MKVKVKKDVDVTVHFVGNCAISRVEQCWQWYANLIEGLATVCQVLTAHGGPKSFHYRGYDGLWRQLAAEEIMNRELNFLQEANLLVVEASCYSDGVACLIGSARQADKPVIMIRRIGSDGYPTVRYSPLVEGDQCIWQATFEQEQVAPVKQRIKEILEALFVERCDPRAISA